MDGNKKIAGIVFAGIIILALTACKVQPPGYVGLYIDSSLSVNDTTDPGQAPLNMLDPAMTQVGEARSVIETEPQVFSRPAEEIYIISSDSSYPHEVEKLLQVITDSMDLLRYQIIEPRNQHSVMPDASFSGEKPREFQPLDSLQAELDFKQPIPVKIDTIDALSTRLNDLKHSGISKANDVYMMRETAASPVVHSQQTDPLTLKLLQAQNDTIQFLRSQLRNLQSQPDERDTVYIDKEAKEAQAPRELVDQQKATDLQALQDAKHLLKPQELSKEDEMLQGLDTTTLVIQVERDALYKALNDTTLIVAFYERGKIMPLEEAVVLKQIQELCNKNNVMKITLSGYSDGLGSEIINKEITNRRLDYLSERIIPWTQKEKIFFQNFGNAFSSGRAVSDERRIEIRVYTR